MAPATAGHAFTLNQTAGAHFPSCPPSDATLG